MAYDKQCVHFRFAMTLQPLQTAFATVHHSLREGMNEDDIERLFQNVYIALGHTQIAKHIRSKRVVGSATVLGSLLSFVGYV